MADSCSGTQVYSLIGLVLQFIIYGAYLILFLSSCAGLVKNWQRGSRVFVLGNVTLFSLITFDTAIKIYTLIYANGHPSGDGEALACALQRWGRWDTFTTAVNLNLVIWIMDILLIYRCFIIWGSNWRVILLPCILLAFSIAINTTILCYFSHPVELDYLAPSVTILLHLCYPMSFAINLLTTSLIAYAILRQHFQSAGTGARLGTGFSLVYIARVVIESALVYTLQVLVLSILHQIKHPAVAIFQYTLAPSVGMTFSLMAVRIDSARAKEVTGPRSEFSFAKWPRSSDFPSTGSPSEQSSMSCGSDKVIDGIKVEQERITT